MQVLSNVKVLSKEKIKVLAERKGWTIAHAEGYVDGDHSRKRGLVPSKFLMVGIDDYCRGFRAGYFAVDRKQPAAEQARK